MRSEDEIQADVQAWDRERVYAYVTLKLPKGNDSRPYYLNRGIRETEPDADELDVMKHIAYLLKWDEEYNEEILREYEERQKRQRAQLRQSVPITNSATTWTTVNYTWTVS